MTEKQNTLVGVLYALLAFLLLIVMAVLVKAIDDRLPVMQVLFFRFLIGTVVLGLPVLARRKAVLRMKNWPLHLGRVVTGTTAVACFFYAIPRLTLMEYTTLGKMYSCFVAVLGVLILRESVKWYQIAAIVIGFAGVYIIAQPQWSLAWLPIIAMVAGTFLAALSDVIVRVLSRDNHSLGIVFFYFLIATCVAGAAQPFFWQPINALDIWLEVLGVGITGAAMQYALAQAFRHLPAAQAGILSYTELIWSFAFGLSLWQEVPTAAVWSGMTLIVAAGLMGQGLFPFTSSRKRSAHPVGESQWEQQHHP